MDTDLLTPKYATDFGQEAARLMFEYIELAGKAQERFWKDYPFITKVSLERGIQLLDKNQPDAGYRIKTTGARLEFTDTHLEKQAELLKLLIDGYSLDNLGLIADQTEVTVKSGTSFSEQEVKAILVDPAHADHLEVCAALLHSLKPLFLYNNWPALSHLFERPAFSNKQEKEVVCRPHII